MVDWAGWEKNTIAEKEKQAKIKKWTGEWTARFFSVRGKGYVAWMRVYHNYLNSPLWKEVRQKALVQANGFCEKCHEELFDPDVHHKTYRRVGGYEKPQDLLALCYSCHINADEERRESAEETREEERYKARVDGFAIKFFNNEEWWLDYAFHEAEIEFIKYLYRKDLKESGNEQSPFYDDPEDDTFFYGFWDEIKKGNDIESLDKKKP